MATATRLVELSMVPSLAKEVATQIDNAGGSSTALNGTFVANGASNVTVNNANLAAGDSVLITLNTVGGTVGAVPSLKTRTNGVGFAVAGTAADTSIYNYRILKV